MVWEIFHLSSAIKIPNNARDVGLNVTFSTQTPLLSSKENTSKDIKTDEVGMEIQHKCLQQGVYYIEGKKEENKYEYRKRCKQLRSKVKNTQSGRVEIELRQQCLQYGVRYIDREKDESCKKCMKRRKLMRSLTCHETRPQFHAAKPSEKFHTENRKPHEVPSLVIIKGRCERYHREYLAKRNKPDYMFTFSGKYSNTDVDDFLTHNNMHFGEIPPYIFTILYFGVLLRKVAGFWYQICPIYG